MNGQTLNQLKQLNLPGMASAFASNVETENGKSILSMNKFPCSSMLNGMKDITENQTAVEDPHGSGTRHLLNNPPLVLAKVDGSYLRERTRIEKLDLLIIDDFGIQPLDTHSKMCLMEIMEDRHGKSSTIVTSQVPVAGWYEIIGEQTIADAILDRIIHDAHRVELKGESVRNKENKAAELDK